MKADGRTLITTALFSCTLIGVFIFSVTIILLVGKQNSYEESYDIIYSQYQIQEGDTAYGIAHKNKYPEMDSRDYIRELGEINGDKNFFIEPLRKDAYLLVITYVPK